MGITLKGFMRLQLLPLPDYFSAKQFYSTMCSNHDVLPCHRPTDVISHDNELESLKLQVQNPLLSI